MSRSDNSTVDERFLLAKEPSKVRIFLNGVEAKFIAHLELNFVNLVFTSE